MRTILRENNFEDWSPLSFHKTLRNFRRVHRMLGGLQVSLFGVVWMSTPFKLWLNTQSGTFRTAYLIIRFLILNIRFELYLMASRLNNSWFLFMINDDRWLYLIRIRQFIFSNLRRLLHPWNIARCWQSSVLKNVTLWNNTFRIRSFIFLNKGLN